MKTLNVSDEDYTTLVSLIQELNEQENDGNASPVYWVPRSTQMVPDVLAEGEPFVFDNDGVEKYSIEEFWKYNSENETSAFDAYKEWQSIEDEEPCDYSEDEEPCDYSEDEWLEFLADNHNHNAGTYYFSLYYEKPEAISEQNPSLFKSDVKGFIEGNKHHLGENPHTYANTIWRMPKMEQLISIVQKLK